MRDQVKMKMNRIANPFVQGGPGENEILPQARGQMKKC